MKIHSKTIAFFTDCKMALQNLNKTKLTDTLTRTTVEALRTLQKQNNYLLLRWVKGHDGTTGNQEADIEAKTGMMREDKILKEDFTPTTKTMT